jgi:PhoPQ-activated pathogenicity-related protein
MIEIGRAGLPALVIAAAIGLGGSPAEAQVLTDPATALEDYVALPDGQYRWRLAESDFEGDGYATHILRMVSQKWRTKAEVDPPIWRHWLVVMVPDEIRHPTAALVIAGGSRTSDRPSADDTEIDAGAQLAVISGTPVAVLMQAPEQPMSFADEPWAHKEDEIVAYSWDKAIETDDYSWPVYLPMAKAAVRAMDTIQAFLPTVGANPADDFVVIGGSKRGAATWLTAVVDDRVRAIAPMVIDIARFDLQMEHHLAVYGEYAPAIHDYVDYNLVQRVDTPEGERLRQVIDPWSYRSELDMPKYILNSTGDQFFPPDSWQFYVPDLLGENMLRYVPNSDHSLSNTDGALIDAISGLFGWYLAIINDLPRPLIAVEKDGWRLSVDSSPPPLAARLWTAKNRDGRDFRLETIGEDWEVRTLAPKSEGSYAIALGTPKEGWKASFVELVYPSAQPGLCQVYSTGVFVTPEVRPFEGTEPSMVETEPQKRKTVRRAVAGSESGVLRRAGMFDDAGDFVDGLAGSISEDLHEVVLEEALGDDFSERALSLCAARTIDDFDDAIELYARLGTGQSFDGFAGDQLEEVRDDAGDFGGSVFSDVDDFADDAFDDIGDTADDVVDDIGDGADEAVDFVGDLF